MVKRQAEGAATPASKRRQVFVKDASKGAVVSRNVVNRDLLTGALEDDLQAALNELVEHLLQEKGKIHPVLRMAKQLDLKQPELRGPRCVHQTLARLVNLPKTFFRFA